MAGRPYVTSRSGRFQWWMQRVSAVLLLVLVFVHFFLQHFTQDAVTTGLTVSARFNNPWWQGFYVIFVVLGLYHGVNGLVGIMLDYMPHKLIRGIVAMVLWTAAAFIGVIGIANVVTPRPLSETKEFYAENGFAEGATRGSPPLAPEVSYDYTPPFAELPMLRYYLVEHTHHDEAVDVAQLFGGERYQIPKDQVEAISGGFDTWLLEVIAEGEPDSDAKRRGEIFSSLYEYAVWAANVRKANAERSGNQDVLQRLSGVPAYAPSIH